MDMPLVDLESGAAALQCGTNSCFQNPKIAILNALKEDNLRVFSDILADVKSVKDEIDKHYGIEESFNSLLFIACELGREKFIELLLEYGADINQNHHLLKLKPIHMVAEQGDFTILNLLLKYDKVDVNAKNKFGRTALHILASQCGVKDPQDGVQKKTDRFLICLETLLDHPAITVDEEDLQAQTPLYHAAYSQSQEAVILLLKYGACLVGKIYGKTLRDIIDEKLPGLLDKVQLNDANTTQHRTSIKKQLFNALYKGPKEYQKFQDLINDVKVNNNTVDLNDSDGKYSYLQYACDKGYEDFVTILLQNGADPNGTSSNNSRKPVLLAAHHGHHRVLTVLKNNKNTNFTAADDSTQETVLHEILKRDSKAEPNAEQRLEMYERCVSVLLDERDPDFKYQIDLILNSQDFLGNTPLHYTTQIPKQEIVKAFLQRGANIGIKNKLGKTPIIHILPQTMEDFLDNDCMETNGALADENFEITFKYRFLAPPRKYNKQVTKSIPFVEDAESGTSSTITEVKYKTGEALPETESLWYMSQSKAHRYLLKHPVITSFLWLKWHRIRHYFYLDLLLYLFFVTALTAYIILQFESSHKSGPVADRNVDVTYTTQNTPVQNKTTGASYIWYLLVCLITLLILRELFQMTISVRRYIFSLENLLEVSMIIITCIILHNHDVSNNTTRNLSATVILLSWMELVLLIGRHPKLSTYITMFISVSFTFFFFLLWYSVIIIAFAISFYILFHTEESAGDSEADPNFKTQGETMLKTLVMLVGELDFGALPFANNVVSRLVFVTFLFLIVLVLMNLLNGLAVSDTQAIKNEAEIVSYASRVELISYIESTLLGDPFSFLSNWPPFRWFQYLPSCAFCHIVYRFSFIRRFLGWVTGGTGVLLFNSWLEEKDATFYPNRPSKRFISNSFAGELSVSPEILETAKSHILKKMVNPQSDNLKLKVLEVDEKLQQLGKIEDKLNQLFDLMKASSQ